MENKEKLIDEGYDDTDFFISLKESDLMDVLKNETNIKWDQMRKFIVAWKTGKCVSLDGGLKKNAQTNKVDIPTEKLPPFMKELLLPDPQAEKHSFFKKVILELHKQILIYCFWRISFVFL